MIAVVMVAGALAVAAGWRAVARKRASIWVAMAAVNVVAGGAALATGRVGLSPKVDPSTSGPIGALAGLGLYLATVIFVLFVRRLPAFARHVEALYDQRGGLPLPLALVLASGITAPGEEVFWRGLFQPTRGALLTWVVYVAANAPSASLPIFAAAVVGGAAWGGLALWTGGVLASALCHAVWTGLMLVAPPPGAANPVARETV